MDIKELLKNKKFINAIVILLIGIIALIGSKSLFSTESDKPKTSKAEQTSEVIELEGRLEKILSTIKGAGSVSVFVMLDDLGTYDYVKDTKQVKKENQDENEETTVLAGGSSNNGPIITRTYSPTIKGVIVTAEGAGNSEVREKIKTAVETSLAIMPHRIEVVEGVK